MDMQSISQKLQDDIRKIMDTTIEEKKLVGGQVNLDKNHNGKLDGQDFKILRSMKKPGMKNTPVAEAANRAQQAAIAISLIKAGKKDGKMPKPMKEANHADEAQDKKLIKKMMKKEETEQTDEAMSHQAKTTMKHIPNASPALKKAAKDIKPGIAGYQDRVAMLKAGGVKEEAEQTDEATLSAKAGRAGKDLGAPGKNFSKIASSAAKRYGSEEAGKRVAGAILAKMRKEEVKKVVSPFDYKNYKSQIPKKPGELTGHDSKKTSTGTVYSKKPVKEDLSEGKMDKMSLSSLWHKHAQHSYAHDQGYGHGTNNPDHNEHAATAIENHVRKTHGNNVANDMVSHSEHHVAHAEYAGPEESKHLETAAAKLRSKHNITGSIHGMTESTIKEEIENLDELSKTTLGSYAKKASRDAVITRKIGADFENKADKARSPGMKAAGNELSQKYKSKSFKRRNGLDKAVDRLTKEEFSFSDYLVAAIHIVGEEHAVELANYAYNLQDESIFENLETEAFNASNVNAQHAAGVKAHHDAELKKKADAGDENAKKRMELIKKSREAKTSEFNSRMDYM
jgi:hypothetical protein